MSYPIDAADEEFNLLYRDGGGYPVDDRERVFDLVDDFYFLETMPNHFSNVLREMGVQFEDGREPISGASGFANVPPRAAFSESDDVQFKLWDERIHATVWSITAKRVVLIVNNAIDAIRARLCLAKTGYTVSACRLVADVLPKRAATTYAATSTRQATVPAASNAFLSDWI